YQKPDGTKVSFFALKIGTDIHCINFPYMASVLANIRDEREKYLTTKVIAIISLVIALLSYINSVT
ncbi:MAG: hypothetical protein PHX56_08775, partial [Atribacterota bacterium]|nr:hypothetical protein [Atribacterota bacterium]